MYFTNNSMMAFEQMMQGVPGFDRYDDHAENACHECRTCRFHRPHWKHQSCVYVQCPYDPGKCTRRENAAKQ
ncbi:MAG: hypothetical protein GXZ14_01350 [Ruminococcaceae bacterium]|jgi:hypothetical protein|nr:hypothetical protein [Oscillospiraceae bacterium]